MAVKNKLDRLDKPFCRDLYHTRYHSIFECTELYRWKFSHDYFAGHLYKLETFVDELLSNDEIPFVSRINRTKQIEYEYTRLAESCFTLIPKFVGIVKMMSANYEYSERINVFIAACDKLDLLSTAIEWSNNIWLDPQKVLPYFDGMFTAEVFNALVDEIRIMWKSTYKTRSYSRSAEARKRYFEYCNYSDALFDDCSRQVIVRVDLYYKKEYSNSVTLQQAQKDLAKLYENERKNSTIFGHKIGFIQKIEYGDKGKGIHIHMIYFFDGSKRKNSSHVYLAQMIGEYWEFVITKGRGNYWNINGKAREYEKKGVIGIGVVNADDTVRRGILKNRVIQYLCKTDQYIKPKIGAGVKLLRRGNVPKKPVIKHGRPRKNEVSMANVTRDLG